MVSDVDVPSVKECANYLCDNVINDALFYDKCTCYATQDLKKNLFNRIFD